ncbi:MAG TPA: glycerol-3-phosphate 1-O-acyltransferase PlsY [Chthoniobacterales bacterium]|nr:glycerol-3-phosphate 1-O-acyltransferase PlsY [Chthoniobacterales bacterium]
MWSLLLICGALSYLFGSFPAGYFAGRLAGVDVRKEGSGNIGATNVLRVLGKRWGYPVFLIDVFKGLAAVRLAFYLVRYWPEANPSAEYVAIFAAIMCVVGHSFPIWLRFKGGKGVATSAGAICGLMPLALPAVLLVWVIVFYATRYVSLASVIASVSLPVVVAFLARWKLVDTYAFIYFSLLLALLVVWRHRSNFSRLLNGTEQRFSRK